MSDAFSADLLAGKVAIVTGAARGLGEVIARRLIECGARVVVGDILDDEGEALAKDLGESAIFVSHDVTQEEQWSRIVERANAAFGRIDVLVSNAARLHMGTLENTPGDVARGVLEVNTLGPYLGICAVIPTMKQQGVGSIVNVSSIDGMIGMNGVTAYATSKWGLRGLTKAAALELGRSGIRVNTVCPSDGSPTMYGPWMERMIELSGETAAYSNDRAIPGGVPPRSTANAIVFLASDASQHITGIDLPVDGGATAGHFVAGFNTL